MRIVRDFSAVDGFRRDAHLDIRREAQRQTCPRRRSKLQVAAHARQVRQGELGLGDLPVTRKKTSGARGDQK